jgi:site-specific DNA-methyltransferase (adenine-specific)
MDTLINKITCGRWQDYADSIPDKSIDAIIVDPPYGIGMGEWDTVDIAEYITFVNRVCKKFFAFFGQFPSINDWFNECKKFDFKYLEHVSWVKRTPSISKRLCRAHEEILIFGFGNYKFEKTKGIYQDVKVPGLHFDCIAIESIQRYIAELKYEIKNGEQKKKSYGRSSQDVYKRFGEGEFVTAPDTVNYTNVWSFIPPTRGTRNGQYLHPTAKPLEIIKRLIEMLTKENDIILDNYSGSGTTAHACLELNRQFICFEQDTEYYNKSIERITPIIEQGRFF